MNKETIFGIIIIAIGAYFFYKLILYNIQLEKEAKASVARYNSLNSTNYSYLGFIKIQRKNPDWLSLDATKQKELIDKYGYGNLMFRCYF